MLAGDVYLPDFLSHYYERATGPFSNLSDLPEEEAERVLNNIREKDEIFASRRAADYLDVRRELEARVRVLFVAKGGQPCRERPHYMILGACPWLQAWYIEGCELRIPLAAFSPGCVSFTYGDTFPAMRYRDGKPYRGQVYTLAELPALVAQFGLPQHVNAEGKLGPDRYIEAQIWDDAPLQPYIQNLYTHLPGR